MNDIVTAARRLLDALDLLDKGCRDSSGFLDWENGAGEPVGFEIEDAREELEKVLCLSKQTITWDNVNARRVYLIFKEVYASLSSEEKLELDNLQSAADARSSLVAPLPIRELEKLKKELLSKNES